MAVAFDATAVGTAQTTASTTSSTWTHTVGSGSNLYAIVGVAVGSSTTGITVTVTFGSLTMTSIGKGNTGGTSGNTGNYVQLFGVANPTAGSNTVTVAKSGSSIVQAGSSSFTGVGALGTPTVYTPNGNSTGLPSAATTTSITSNANNMLVDVVGSGTGSTALTPDTSPTTGSAASTLTRRWSLPASSSFGCGNGAQSTAPGASSVWWGWTTPSDYCAGVLVELQAAATSVATAPIRVARQAVVRSYSY